ncbi:hypothetical protein [Methyloceanibacter caenitepidi]|uniref:ASCH domain-containing protein n=1 Tax=Methyloceanibacter caenitepidi TaxID=1384459 RepID=A0A0A8K2H3_9HYPH|nr:hypothetical protein [Methyloceanibacter caenitepidi]BAQ16961.1 hypothetical protein GL4_1505 [Methyloceanibacter caenitepidi]
MKALTIYQPWASLVLIGAKPYEFRKWNFIDRPGGRALLNKRIVIHAASRPVHDDEVADLLRKLAVAEQRGASQDLDHGTALKVDLARTLLTRVYAAHSHVPILPLRCGLGTAVLGRPRRPEALFGGSVADSKRFDQHVWAWPLSDVQPFDAPIPARGQQGFWDWELGQQAA